MSNTLNRAVFLDAATVGDVDLSPLNLILDEFKTYEHTKLDEVVDRALGYPILIVNKVPISREDLANLPDLRLICVAATGMNNIDLEACREMKITVKNVESYSTDSVAQFTLNLLLHSLHSNSYYGDYTSSGKWAESQIFTNLSKPFFELRGKTWGIVGLGRIGKRVAEIARVMGCHVVYTSTSGKNNDDTYEQLSLARLFEVSDIVSLHCSLNADTEGLVNYELLKVTKKKPILINVARGPIVIEEDICEAIREGFVSHYATDVMFFEPPQRNHPFFYDDIKNKIFVSPHIAWSSIEARRRLIEGIRKNILEIRL